MIKKKLKIRVLITTNERCGLISLIKEYANVFTWSYADITSLDIDILVYKLPLIKRCKFVKHKLRRARFNVLIKVKKKVKKQ